MKSILPALLMLTILVTIGQSPINWKATGIGGGGALFSPSINPANHNEIYMACDMSELFHTLDTGASWTQANFHQLQGGHDSKVQFTDSANILYTVDYTNLEANSYIRAMKSIDGGQTWQPLAGDPYDSNPSVLMRLLVDPHNAQHVFIADYCTMYFSTDGGNSFTLFHSCVNNGSGNNIAGAYFNGDSIYIATYDGLFYSTNGGNNFSVMATTGIPAQQRMLTFAGGKQNGTVRFYCLTADSDNVYAGITYGDNYYGTWAGVYTMDGVNGAWTEKVNGISTTSGSSDYPMLVGMAENSIDTAYLSGGSDAGSPIVLKTTDGGNNWSHVFLTVDNQNIFTGWAGWEGDQGWDFPEAPFGFTVAQNDAQMAMFTDYSCAHVTTDGGANWRQQYLDPADENPEDAPTPVGKNYHSAGMENTSNWNLMWTDPAHIFSGFSDIGGVMSADSGNSWKFIPIGYNCIYHIVQHPDGTVYAATSSVHDMYQTPYISNGSSDGGTGEVYLSTDTGKTFSVLHNFGHPVIRLALDPNRPDRMYAAVINSSAGGIYATNNLSEGASSTWTKLATPPRTLGHPSSIHVLNDGSLVASFSATITGNTFSQSSGVFYSTDSGASWFDRSDPMMEYYTQDVVIDPTDSTQNTWYAAVFAGWANANGKGNGLFRTTNRGQNWTQLSDEYRVNSCTVNPNNPNEMYYTTETNGLWYTENLAATTPTFVQDSTYPFRSTVRVNYNPYNNSQIWISSFGNGMRYSAPPNTVVTGLAKVNNNNGLQMSVFPNPAHGQVHISWNMNTSETGTLSLFDLAGQLLKQQSVSANSGLNNTTLNMYNYASGMYLLELKTSDNVALRKLILE